MFSKNKIKKQISSESEKKIEYMLEHWYDQTYREMAKHLGCSAQRLHQIITNLRRLGVNVPKKIKGPYHSYWKRIANKYKDRFERLIHKK